jgi:hypothetical protein
MTPPPTAPTPETEGPLGWTSPDVVDDAEDADAAGRAWTSAMDETEDVEERCGGTAAAAAAAVDVVVVWSGGRGRCPKSSAPPMAEPALALETGVAGTVMGVMVGGKVRAGLAGADGSVATVGRGIVRAGGRTTEEGD